MAEHRLKRGGMMAWLQGGAHESAGKMERFRRQTALRFAC